MIEETCELATGFSNYLFGYVSVNGVAVVEAEGICRWTGK